jgi:UDP-N-acetylmuramoyl-tripeptide--D-alanyl-D-alanine ligase
MPAEFSAEEIIDICGGRLAQGMMPDGVGIVCTDTRQLGEGQWYLALSGEKFDGHDFLGDAFARGAVGAIVAERPQHAIGSNSFPLIAVEDTLMAFHALARNWRRRINPKVVAITGSSGKTTTKEMCAAVFAAGSRTHKSPANENNEFGVPKTILAMPDDTEVLVVELAMRARGEITLLASTAQPDIGIIVNVGVAHLGVLASLENIVAAKCELIERLDARRGVAIIGAPTETLMNRVQAVFGGKTLVFEEGGLRETEVTPEATTFELAAASGAGKSSFTVRGHGLSHLQDAWCAITAARQLGVNDAMIAKGLQSYNPVSGRGNRLSMENGAVVVDEAYNGNPDSVRSSVASFVDERVFRQPKKYVVLGELAELGEQAAELHRSLGSWLSEKKLTGLITVGPVARHIADGAQTADFEVLACQDQEEAERVLRERLSADSCVLIKGSHCAQLERLVSRLVAKPVTSDA